MEAKLEKSSITKLQEICQRWKLPMPTYRESEGSYQEFGSEVTVSGLPDGPVGFTALGRTKKQSKANVAEKALQYIEQNHPDLLELPPLPELDPVSIAKRTQLNKQKTSNYDQHELAKETEQLSHVHVGLDMGRLIQQTRQILKLSQKDLAGRINEKPQIISEYESGKAIPNMQVIAKLERVLGVYLTGAKAGQAKGGPAKR